MAAAGGAGLSGGGVHSRAQIAEFIRFFDVKRDLYVTEIGHIFKDMRESRCVCCLLLRQLMWKT